MQRQIKDAVESKKRERGWYMKGEGWWESPPCGGENGGLLVVAGLTSRAWL